MSIDIPKNMKLKMKHGELNNGINYVVIKKCLKIFHQMFLNSVYEHEKEIQ